MVSPSLQTRVSSLSALLQPLLCRWQRQGRNQGQKETLRRWRGVMGRASLLSRTNRPRAGVIPTGLRACCMCTRKPFQLLFFRLFFLI